MKYTRKIPVLVWLLGSVTLAYANSVQCVAIVEKNPQWENYDVVVTMLDFDTQQAVAVFDLKAANPAQKQKSMNEVSQKFDCYKVQNIQFTAKFTPAIWSTNIGKSYDSKQVWNITQQLMNLDPKIKKLEVNITFPQDFIGVPQLIN